MKIILDTGQEVPITWSIPKEGERVFEAQLENGDLLFVQLLEGWSVPVQENQLSLELPEMSPQQWDCLGEHQS